MQTLAYILSQNGQTYFQNFAANAIKNMNRVSVSDRFLRILVLMLDLNMKNGSFFDESKVCHLLEHYHPPLHVFIFQLA